MSEVTVVREEVAAPAAPAGPAESPRQPKRRRAPRRNRSFDAAVDALFAVSLTLLGLVGFRYAFGRDGYMVVGTIAAIAGALVALAVVRWKLPGLLALALALVAFLVLGAAVAIRDESIAGILPTPNGITGLVDGTTSGWRRLLTTLPPSGSLGNLYAIPFLCGYVPALVSTLLARRTRLLGVLLVLPGVVLGLSVLFGDRQPFSLLVQGALFAVVAIGWMVVRRARERRVYIQSSGTKRVAGGLVMLALIGVAGFALGPHLPLSSSNERYVLPRDDPPFDPRQYGSPLNGFGKYLNGPMKDKVMFTVSGVPQLAGEDHGLVRLAAMDDYNGVVWEVNPQSGSRAAKFLRVGETVPTDVVGDPVSLDVQIGDLAGVWVPNTGVVTGISWSSPGDRAGDQRAAFRLSTSSQTAVSPTAGGLAEGDRYTIRSVVPPTPDDEVLRHEQVDLTLPTRVDVVVPDELSAKASEIVKDQTSAFDQATALNEWFRQHGYYTAGDGKPGTAKLTPGHSSARLAQFMATDAPVGSAEQFAAAMALMARKVGLPARVVMGFQVRGSGTVDVKGSDVDAWVEIPFVDSAGTTTWVRFDPTPRDRQETPPDQVSKAPRPKYESQDVPPPPIPPPPADEVAAESGTSKPKEAPKKPNEERPAEPADHTLLYVAGAAVAVPLALATGFAAVVLGLKARRRRKRRKAAIVPNRVAGGWDEYVDAARDMGMPVPPRSTRKEVALLVGAPPGVDLARQADSAVFGPDQLTDDDVAAYWQQVTAGRKELHSRIGWSRRLRASLSLTSLRRSV